MEPHDADVPIREGESVYVGEDLLSFLADEAGRELSDPSSFLIHGLVHDLTNHLTIIAHSVELAEMLDELTRYKEICAQIAETCEKAHAVLIQVNELAHRGEDAARSVDLFTLTRDVARRVRAWLPDADLLRVSLPTNGESGATVFGKSREIQELFFYLAGVLAPLERPLEKRPNLWFRMESVEAKGRPCAFVWVFEALAGTAEPLFWRALFRYQERGEVADMPFSVHRAGRILTKHFARVEWLPQTATLRILWPISEG
jgi:hypothetical protein